MMKRKKLLLCSIVVGCIAALVFIAGCSLDPIAFPTEFSGTWQGADSEVFVFTSLKITRNGSILGSAEYKVTSYDESANHIFTTFASGSGIYALVPVGSTYYWNYSITGNEMVYDNSGSGYPTTTAQGPLTKQ
jgi:hypothetical protein